MSNIYIPEYVRSLDPYKPGNVGKKVQFRHDAKMFFSLASNENPLGTSQKVIDAVTKSINNFNLYPDPSSNELVNKLAERFNKRPTQIVAGHGSESLMAHIVNGFSDIDTRVLTSMGTFAGIYVKTHKIGRKLNRVPLKNYGYDLDGIISRIHENTKIIYISNPNNPTGSMITRSEFEWFMNQVPENILVVLDEAYSTYAEEHEGYFSGLEYDLPNLLVLHTLSKTHGLAGLRVGYAIGPEEIIQTLYKIKLPFEPSLIAQKAAVAALEDYEYLLKTIELNRYSLNMMKDTFKKINIHYVDPRANFIMILMEDPMYVQEFCDHTQEHGVTVRNCRPFGLSNAVRISTGTEEQTDYACQVFEHVYKEHILKMEIEG